MFKKEVLSQLYRTADRRTFLKACGALGIGVAAGGVIQAVYKVVKIDSGLVKVAQTRLAMGTFVSITAVHSSKAQAEEAVGRAFEEIDRLVAVFSRHDNNTPVSVLNREGKLSDTPPELAALIKRSLEYFRTSGGVFDVTVLPLVTLFEQKLKSGSNAVPSRGEIDDALALVGCENLEVASNGRLSFEHAGMGITLDGIAKGYIVDCASHVLSAHGIKDHLINAGGDIRTSGTTSDKKPWTVAIEDPQKKKQYPDVIRMTNGAVATSGSYEIYFDKEKMFHHVIDPRTGVSPRSSASVSVRAGSVMEADALSTAVFVLNPDDGVRLIDSMEHCECLVIESNGRQYRSVGWEETGVKAG